MDATTLFIYAICVVLGWYIFYLVIKAAVRNGIKEARNDHGSIQVKTGITESPVSEKQIVLQDRYNRGEITFEEYKAEWNK